jgi:hypothetical protein
VPAPPIKLKLKIQPGDLISARVMLRNRYLLLRIHNLSTGRGVTRTVRMRSPDTSSAEWIAEAPSACISPDQCQTLPLADFGAIRFYDANAKTAPGKRGAINDPTFTTTELTLTGSRPGSAPGPGGPGPVSAGSASAEATPGALTGHGSAFTVTVKRPAASPGPQTRSVIPRTKSQAATNRVRTKKQTRRGTHGRAQSRTEAGSFLPAVTCDRDSSKREPGRTSSRAAVRDRPTSRDRSARRAPP